MTTHDWIAARPAPALAAPARSGYAFPPSRQFAKAESVSQLALNGGDPVRERPFHPWPVADQSDVDAVAGAIRGGDWSHLTGPNIRAFEFEFAAKQDARFGIACNGGTAALEIALRAAGVKPGDEVIVPTYTFVATPVAVIHAGAIPVFCDVEEDTFNIDVAAAKAAMTARTTAILPVHYGGRAADVEAILALARKRGLIVIEDACHGWGAKWRNRGLGSLGQAAGFSFQASKNLTAGEGGFVTTNDSGIAEVAARIRRGGDGEAEGKPAVLPGNYRMSEIQAALLRNQLLRLDEQNRVRMANAEYLSDRLSKIPGFRVLRRDPDVTHSSVHVYLWRFISEEFEGLSRKLLVEALRAEGIPVGTGYRAPLQEYQLFAQAPDWLARAGLAAGGDRASIDYSRVRTPVADRLCKLEALALSQSVFLGARADMDDIIAAVAKIREHAGELAGVPVEAV